MPEITEDTNVLLALQKLTISIRYQEDSNTREHETITTIMDKHVKGYDKNTIKVNSRLSKLEDSKIYAIGIWVGISFMVGAFIGGLAVAKNLNLI